MSFAEARCVGFTCIHDVVMYQGKDLQRMTYGEVTDMDHEKLLISERIDEVKMMCEREHPIY
ncbi:MAG: hypothetical protein JW932_20580, partial [Deltaproteobacteria bacterium]|nr:hypothetical protein [Deltaproteobacteria bacterium]